ncbi:MAG TPA: ABC transporter permease, partial [Reyranella sp.]
MANAAGSPIPLLKPASATMRLVWLRIRRNWLSTIALAIIVAMILAALLANWIAPYDPDATDPEAALQSVSLHHWLGTDIYGRDLLSRIIFAARVDLTVAFGATAVALVIGSAIGAIAGHYRGLVDLIIMRCVDSVMAFPAFIL